MKIATLFYNYTYIFLGSEILQIASRVCERTLHVADDTIHGGCCVCASTGVI